VTCKLITLSLHVILVVFFSILRYLDTSGRAWARCPLCFESVYKQACKSTKLRVHTPLNAGEKIAFSLVQRSKGSVITFEKGANAGSLLDNIIRTSSGLTKDGKDPLFSRITMTTDIEKVINEERTVLRSIFSLPCFFLPAHIGFYIPGKPSRRK